MVGSGDAYEPPTGGEDRSGEGGGSDDTTAITLTGYFERIAVIYCDQSFMCRAEFPPDLGYTFEDQWGTTIEECRTKLITGWDPNSMETEVAKGRCEYDGAAAVACLAGVTFGTCPDYWAKGIEWAESCYSVVTPLVPLGGTCENSYSCTSFNCDLATQKCI